MLPPGPRQRFPYEHAIAVTRRPLEFLPGLAERWGDAAGFRIGPQPIVLVSHPDAIRDVLVTNARQFHKGRGLERAKVLLGEGLLTSEDDHHLRQRRLAQPAFHRSRVMGYGDVMASYAERRASTWRDGTTLDISKEMAAYTLAVVGKTLFDADIERDAPEIGSALSSAIAFFNFTVLPFGEYLMNLPLPAARRFRRGREVLDATIYRIIAERRPANRDRGDLLSMLLLAQDTEGDGAGMSDEQLRDELMTIFLAGHETTANLLMWAFYLLARHPSAEARLHDELNSLGDGPLGARDVERLPFTRAVVSETLRLYPPAWIVGRRAMSEYQLGKYTLPARTIVLMSQWVVHRDPRWWSDPSAFTPERWLPGGSALNPDRPKFSFFPFGAGTRVCIGEQFAWMEATLALAAFARRWRMRLVADQRIEPQPIITLRAKGGMRMVMYAR